MAYQSKWPTGLKLVKGDKTKAQIPLYPLKAPAVELFAMWGRPYPNCQLTSSTRKCVHAEPWHSQHFWQSVSEVLCEKCWNTKTAPPLVSHFSSIFDGWCWNMTLPSVSLDCSQPANESLKVFCDNVGARF